MQIKTNLKKILAIGIIFVFFLLAIFIGPMDVLHHGYYSERPTETMSVEAALQDLGVAFENGVIQYTVIAESRHLEALEIYLEQMPEEQSGQLEITLSDGDGTVLARNSCLISDLEAEKWNKISISKSVSEGESYLFTISDADEMIGGSVLLTYGYSMSTLTVFGKLMIIMLMILMGLFVVGMLWFRDPAKQSVLVQFVFGCFVVYLLSWSYFSNPFDNANETYEEFQQDSDALVFGRIIAKENNVFIDRYGLGRCVNIKGEVLSLDIEVVMPNGITSEKTGFEDGYSQDFSCAVWPINIMNP